MNEAQELMDFAISQINKEPQPEDIMAILDGVREKMPSEWLPYFDDLYEAARAAL